MERASGLVTVRQNRWKNIWVHRSVIRQQHAISGLYNPTMNTTVALPERERGNGEVDGEIVINKIS